MIAGGTCHRKSKVNSFIFWETTWRKIYWIEFEKPLILRSYQTVRQISVILIKWVSLLIVVEDKEVKVRKSFLGFITENEKTAYDMKKMILDRLKKEKLDFEKRRGIGFDNAASVVGVYGGVQRLLRNINEEAKFVPCSNNSLNLCSVHASTVNASTITFFRVIFPFFQSPVGSFIFVCEGHDETLGNHPLACMLRSYSCSEKQISRSDSGTWFINLRFRKSSNERGCTIYCVFIWKLLHVTFVLLGRTSGTNKSHPKETLKTWYWFKCVCNPHGCDQNFL